MRGVLAAVLGKTMMQYAPWLLLLVIVFVLGGLVVEFIMWIQDRHKDMPQ